MKQVHVGSRLFFYPEEIEFIQAHFSYSIIYLKNGKKILVSTHLRKLQERFAGKMIRVHRSFLINPMAELYYSENEFFSKTGNRGLISRRLKKNLINEHA